MLRYRLAALAVPLTLVIGWASATAQPAHPKEKYGSPKAAFKKKDAPQGFSCSPGELECDLGDGTTYCSPVKPCPKPSNGETTFANPQIGCMKVDATTWDYPGGEPKSFEQKAATLFCQTMKLTTAKSFAIEQAASPVGTYRFQPGGHADYCPFCSWFFTSISCK